jgi:DNA-binding CsgD family transcriptional regulator
MDRQFDRWALTTAEREVALLLLKGLSHKEAASVRGTSERTVRQQSLMVYKKAGVTGRAELSAFFLEDLLDPTRHATSRGGPAPAREEGE